MSEPFRRRSVLCASPSGLHRLAYLEWGDSRNPRTLVCVHGLTRVSRDFDAVAAALASHYRVICPDLPGRGDSDWLKDPNEYTPAIYLADMVTLIARLDVAEVDWFGTSLGGLVGMLLAAQAGSPIRRLVLNDVGPFIPAAAMERIDAYLGKAPTFASMDEAEHYVRVVSAPFGPHSDDEWRFLTEHVVRPLPDGRYRMHYDPGLAIPYAAQRPYKDALLWGVWDAVRAQVLVVRGALSDLLLPETAREMTERGPRAALTEIPGVGHAPTFLREQQIAPVREFLLAT